MARPPYEYSPITEREFSLPGGARVALWVVPNIEHFVFDEPREFHRLIDEPPDISNHSLRDYGNRVGVWRLFDVLDGFDVPGTVALNAAVCEHEPPVVEAAMDRDWEFMGHGITNSQLLSGLGEDEERAVIAETRDRIAAFTGTEPRGWLGPSRAETFATPRLLVEAGFEYVGDYVNDDQPYRVATAAGDLVSMPYTTVVSDKLFERGGVTAPAFERIIRDQFDVLYDEGAEPGNAKVMAISLHPYLVGIPHRSRYLANALEYVTAHDDVWVTTGGEIVDHYLAHHA